MAANVFNSVKSLHPKRNKFSADTYRNDFTAPIGANIPVFIKHALPSERVKCSASALCRLQALIAPVMDNIDFYVHFWKMPYRLLENDRFTAFISGELESEDYDALFATPFALAQNLFQFIGQTESTKDFTAEEKVDFYANIVGNGSLLDFLGYDVALFPVITYDEEKDEYIYTGGNNVNSLNWRGLIAYYMLHVNWYMNENVPYFESFLEYCDSLIKEQNLDALCMLLIETNGMFNNGNKFALLPHAWEKDYYTGALPNVQAGDPVTLSIGGTAPVAITGGSSSVAINDPQVIMQTLLPSEDSVNIGAKNNSADSSAIADLYDDSNSQNIAALVGEFSPRTSGATMFTGSADLSEATAITINELRFANALQVFKERQLRFGKRRQEYYKGFFDVEPEDLRLQIPKYLGGGRIPINISDIEQTSQTSGNQALGHLAGKGTAVAGGFAGFSTFCSEESIIIGIAFAMPHITYAQALSKMNMKTNDRYDYFNPSFEHLGEQEIKNVELYAGSANPNGVFGYTPRFTEYRFHINEMHGEFKSSLAFWSLGRIFSSQPALNANFVYMQPAAFDRIFAVANQPNLVVSMLFHVRSIKPVSKYGTPMLLA